MEVMLFITKTNYPWFLKVQTVYVVCISWEVSVARTLKLQQDTMGNWHNAYRKETQGFSCPLGISGFKRAVI